jgi:formylglycine-generating enzyme required for sulfatase activity
MDVDTIPLGVDFVEYITDQVNQCDVLLAIIGDGWLDARTPEGTRRLDDANDFVRLEIQVAMTRRIPVVPVLVGRASMPRKKDLPPPLRPLIRRNATDVRSGHDFHDHLARLVRGLQRLLSLGGDARESTRHDIGRETNSPQLITNSLGMQLRLIPGGEFLMGSAESDERTLEREVPQHRVHISKPLYVGVFPVTQEEYEEVCGSNPSGFPGEERRPVESISWFDAVAFCNALSAREGLDVCYDVEGDHVSFGPGSGYRLPTEAEWEYACRSGTTTQRHCGDAQDVLAGSAWYWDNSAGRPHPVGQKNPNEWGLFDMLGNIWEWCWDWADWNYYRESPVDDPLGPSIGSNRIYRGGGWLSFAWYCRSASRGQGVPSQRYNFLGFRVVRALPGQ